MSGWGILRKAERQLRNADLMSAAFDRRRAILHYFRTFALAILVFALEALPLQIALGQEFGAYRWISELLHVDLSMAVNGDHILDNRSSRSSIGSIMVASVMIGKVQYYRTRTVLITSLTILFDATFVGRLICHTFTRFRLLRQVWRYRLNGSHEADGPPVESTNSEAETLSYRGLSIRLMMEAHFQGILAKLNDRRI